MTLLVHAFMADRCRPSCNLHYANGQGSIAAANKQKPRGLQQELQSMQHSGQQKMRLVL